MSTEVKAATVQQDEDQAMEGAVARLALNSYQTASGKLQASQFAYALRLRLNGVTDLYSDGAGRVTGIGNIVKRAWADVSS